jgi:hypothetical protein
LVVAQVAHTPISDHSLDITEASREVLAVAVTHMPPTEATIPALVFLVKGIMAAQV